MTVGLPEPSAETIEFARYLRLPLEPVQRPVSLFRRPRGRQWHRNRLCRRVANVDLVSQPFTLLQEQEFASNSCPSCMTWDATYKMFGRLELGYWEVAKELLGFARTLSAAEVELQDTSTVACELYNRVESVLVGLQDMRVPPWLQNLVIEGSAMDAAAVDAVALLTGRARGLVEQMHGRVVDPEVDREVTRLSASAALHQAALTLIESKPYDAELWSRLPSGARVWPHRWLSEAFTLADAEFLQGSASTVEEVFCGFAEQLARRLGPVAELEEIPVTATLDAGRFSSPLLWAQAEYDAMVAQFASDLAQDAAVLLQKAAAPGRFEVDDDGCLWVVVATSESAYRFMPPSLTRRLLASKTVSSSHTNEWLLCRLRPVEVWLLQQDRPTWQDADALVAPVVPGPDPVATSKVFFDMVATSEKARSSGAGEAAALWPVACAISA